MNNLKDKLTGFAVILGLISGAIITIQTQGIVLPTWLNTAAIVMGVLAVTITSYFTGKNPDGSTKTPAQIDEITDKAEETRAQQPK